MFVLAVLISASLALQLNAAAVGKARSDQSPDQDPPVPWSYDDAANWGSLSPQYNLCSTGTEQSPIDFDGQTMMTRNVMEVNQSFVQTSQWPRTVDSVYVVNTGHSLQLGPFVTTEVDTLITDPMTGLMADYTLDAIHLHVPSEHRILGEMYPLEMQMVHQDDAGNTMVIGVLFSLDDDNSDFLEKAFTSKVKKLHEIGQVQVVDKVYLKSFMRSVLHDSDSAGPGYFAYHGSLTTPPCKQGVQWFVAAKPMTLSWKQWNALKAVIGFNARPTQK